MAKTLIKMIVGVVVLAGVFFFALQYWENQKAKTVTPQPATPLKSLGTSIRDITVLSSPEGAVIQINEMPGPGYKIVSVEDPKGFAVEVPGAEVALTNKVITSPHALVQSIVTTPQAGGGAKIQVTLSPGATYRERLIGTTLYMDITAPVAEAKPSPTATPEPTVEPTRIIPKKIARKKSASPLRTARPPKKVAKTKASTPKPMKPPTPTATPGPLAPIDESDSLMKELGLSEPAPTPAPTQKPSLEAAPQAEEPLDLEKMFNEPGAGLPPVVEPTQPPKVAAIPPPTSDKFDSSKIMANLPAISHLLVEGSGGATIVTIEREAKTKYKIFRMKNPNRVVVDFKDAISRLQSEYAGVPGTKVRRITTQQFVSKDGTISRVMLYVDGEPKYEQDVRGTSFVLKLP